MFIDYINFWPGFDEEPNVFNEYLRNNPEICKRLENSGITKISFQSVFPPRVKRNRVKRTFDRFHTPIVQETSSVDSSCLRIWFTGENVRPPVERDFDAFLSFDLDSFGGRNYYFPLIYLSLNPYINNSQKRLGIEYKSQNLLEPRSMQGKKIPNSICIIAGKHPIRTAVVQEFTKYFHVDVFGGLANAAVKEKYSIARNYEYMFCLENDLYPGYVTEKLVEAYVCETVPLYWGSTEGNPYLNDKSFLNLRDYKDIAAWASHVSRISEQEYIEIYKEPLLRSGPPIEDQLSKLFQSFLQR